MISLRRRLLELAATFGSFLSPHEMSAQEMDRFTLLDVGETGELSVNSGRIDPSLATPVIVFSKCIASVRRSAGGQNFEGDLDVEGVVRSKQLYQRMDLRFLVIVVRGYQYYFEGGIEERRSRRGWFLDRSGRR